MSVPKVAEGRFLEFPNADATGMERRAFGDYTGRWDESAAYAVGWIEESDPRAVRFSVAIGGAQAGTFHLRAVAAGDRFDLEPDDQPFAQVSSASPDILGAAAQHHRHRTYVWHVIDEVLLRDRRAAWMKHWLTGTVCLVSADVFELRAQILRIANTGDGWQAGDGEFVRTSLHAVVDEDRTLLDVLDLAVGYEAQRAEVGGAWLRRVSAT